MIYAITEDGDGSHVKIGYTGGDLIGGEVNRPSLITRLRMLQVGNPRVLLCVAVAPGSEHSEKRLHDEWRSLWVRGEWFRNAGPISEWIEQWGIVPLRSTDRPRGPARYVVASKPMHAATVRVSQAPRWPAAEQERRSVFGRVASRHLVSVIK